MLFTSYIFLYIFLPIALIGYFGLVRRFREAAMLWLLLLSLIFYGWWDYRYVPLLIGSIAFNYLAGAAIAKNHAVKGYLLTISIIANLGLLFWYKYANFFAASYSSILGQQWQSMDIVLPLGISFFTFTQIAFLVDVWKGSVREYNFIHYALFVTYFPHLIAGPVLHHKEMMPQFKRANIIHPGLEDISWGLLLFCIGLAKKILLADSIQPYVAPVFDAESSLPLHQDQAWAGALAYTFQLYFDFSGYSDMAVGLSRMFGIVLPFNFNSPYKSVNIIEFWRCWHMTLSRFLRDYLYIPLGGSRKGITRRYFNLMVTMVLGGLWHGANWTFVVWGGLHGLYLIVNHGWHNWREGRNSMWPIFGRLLTFVSVVVAWVFFRAQSFDSAWRVLRAMSGIDGCSVPDSPLTDFVGFVGCNLNHHQLFDGFNLVWAWIFLCGVIAWVSPNSQALAQYFNAWLFGPGEIKIRQRKRDWAYFFAGMLSASVVLLSAIGGSRTVSEFIYFNF